MTNARHTIIPLSAGVLYALVLAGLLVAGGEWAYVKTTTGVPTEAFIGASAIVVFVATWLQTGRVEDKSEVQQ